MTTPAPAFGYDFFLSRRGTVAAAAQEVADVLTVEGFKVKVRDYDFPHGGKFVLDIHEALKAARNLLILHSHDYDSSIWTREVFANFFSAAAGDSARRIGLLRCDDAVPAGLFHGITRGDLIGVTDPDQRRRIILDVAHGRAPASRPVPRVFGGAMPLENLLFTGRDELLADMHAALGTADIPTALTQAAVHGLGGVGKTSAAREYVRRHGADYPGGVWWITATDRTAF
jgi:hypothetical protein